MLASTLLSVVGLFNESLQGAVGVIDLAEQVVVDGFREDILELLDFAFDSTSIVPKYLAATVQ
jgi:hypothetical protein